jgi:hypothetical protein
MSSLNALNVLQSGIMFFGISCGVLACTAGVAKVGVLPREGCCSTGRATGARGSTSGRETQAGVSRGVLHDTPESPWGGKTPDGLWLTARTKHSGETPA